MSEFQRSPRAPREKTLTSLQKAAGNEHRFLVARLERNAAAGVLAIASIRVC
jgi:hypothetical protein